MHTAHDCVPKVVQKLFIDHLDASLRNNDNWLHNILQNELKLIFLFRLFIHSRQKILNHLIDNIYLVTPNQREIDKSTNPPLHIVNIVIHKLPNAPCEGHNNDTNNKERLAPGVAEGNAYACQCEECAEKLEQNNSHPTLFVGDSRIFKVKYSDALSQHQEDYS